MLNIFQCGMQRRAIMTTLMDPELQSELTLPIHRQLMKMYVGMDVPTITAAMAGTNLDVLAGQLANNLVTGEGLDRLTMTSGSFLTILQQIITMLLSMFTSGCVTPAPVPPTPTQVLAAIQ